MEKNSRKAAVHCVEVLIAEDFLRHNPENLLWTLSVYSLENQPVKKDRDVSKAVIFHFMVYDWRRTIKDLLEIRQIPYSIVQYFDPESIYSDTRRSALESPDSEAAFLSAIQRLPVGEERPVAPRDISPVVPS